MRKYQMAIAKARMKACGIEQINRKMKNHTSEGETMWKSFLWGEFAKQGEAALKPVKLKRKIRKIEPVATA